MSPLASRAAICASEAAASDPRAHCAVWNRAEMSSLALDLSVAVSRYVALIRRMNVWLCEAVSLGEVPISSLPASACRR